MNCSGNVNCLGFSHDTLLVCIKRKDWPEFWGGKKILFFWFENMILCFWDEILAVDAEQDFKWPALTRLGSFSTTGKFEVMKKYLFSFFSTSSVLIFVLFNTAEQWQIHLEINLKFTWEIREIAWLFQSLCGKKIIFRGSEILVAIGRKREGI